MILVSHFDPFGGQIINASREVAVLLSSVRDDLKIIELPTAFEDSSLLLISELTKETPDLLVMLGQAEGRTHVTPEMVAINWKESSTEDNNGYLARGERISPEGPVAFFTGLPVKKIVETLQSEGLPVSLSLTAGSFVCNCLFFSIMEYIDVNGLDIPAGFVHIPCVPLQAVWKRALPTMDALLSARIISRIIEISIEENNVC